MWPVLRRVVRGVARQRYDDEARMSLVEHLRELRSRLVKSALAVLVATVVAWFFYGRLFELLRGPFVTAVQEHRNLDASLTLTGVADAFFLRLKVSGTAGLVAASPVWLYQLWAFITPGLRRHERRYSLGFFATAVPLFLGGCAVAYAILPTAIGLLLAFTPSGVANLVTLNQYFGFVLQLIVVFGIGFELPVFIVLLNRIGVLPHARIASWRRGFWFGILLFAAAATPTPDAFTMLLLALPLIVLFEVAALIARFTDRGRAARRGEPAYDGLGDEEASPLGEPEPAPPAGPDPETADEESVPR